MAIRAALSSKETGAMVPEVVCGGMHGIDHACNYKPRRRDRGRRVRPETAVHAYI